MTILGRAIAFLLLLTPPGAMAADTVFRWTTEGPTNSWVSQIAVDSQSPQTLYAIADGRVCKTVDGGRRWSLLASKFFSTALAVAVDPTRPGRILVATDSGAYPLGGLYLSTDGGASWDPRGPNGPNIVYRVWIDPSQPDTAYADGGNASLFRTLDGGLNWKLLTLPLSSPDFTFAVGSDGSAFVGGEPGQLYRSVDRGESWTPAAPSPLPFSTLRAIVPDPTTPATVWALTGSGLFRSPDRGASWELRGGGSASSLAIDPTNPAVLYAGAVGGVWKTVDAGRTWQPLGVGLPFSGSASVVALTVDAQSPATIYAGTFNNSGDFSQGFYLSEDGGAAWNRSDRGLTGVYVLDLAADPSAPSVLYATTVSHGAGSVCKSRDSGGSWEKTGAPDLKGVSRLAIDPASPATLYIGTGDCPTYTQCQGEVRKSADGGASWSRIVNYNYGVVEALAVDPSDSKTLFASANCINLDLNPCSPPIKSTDGGMTWRSFPGPPGIIRQFLFDPASSGEIYVSSSTLCVSCSPFPVVRTTVFKTRDGGESWSAASSGLPAVAVADQLSNSISRLESDPSSPESVYAATLAGLFRSTDGGSTWKLTGLLDRVWDMAIDPWDLRVLYAATDGSGVLRSTDRGSTWQPINTGLPDLRVHRIVIDSGGTYLHAAPSSGGVYDLRLPRRIDTVEPRKPTHTVGPR